MTTTLRPAKTTFNRIFKWQSLKARVTIITLLIFLVGIWSLAYYAGKILRGDVRRVLSQQQFSTVSITAAHVNQELSDRLQAIEKISARITSAMIGNAAIIQKSLEGHVVLQTMFNGGVYIARADGMVIADVPIATARIGMNVSNRGWMIEALKGKTTIGKPIIGKKLQVPVFSMAAPIRDTAGNVIGVVVAVVDLSRPNFLDNLANSRYGKTGGYLLIAPQHKLFITGTDKSRIMQPFPAPGVNPLFDRYLQGFEGSGVVTDSRGLEVMSSAKQIPVAGWILVARIPTKEAFAPMHDMMRRVLLATIILTLLAGCLMWLMLRRQLSPIFSTIQTLTMLSDTDQHPQPLPIARNDEIGNLIGSFNHLLENLKQRETALKESEERFRTLSDKTPLGMSLIDIDGRYEYVNSAFVQIFGYDLSDIPTGREWFRAAYPDPEYRREVIACWKEALDSSQQLEVRPFIFEVRCKDGAVRTIHFRPVTLPSGKQLVTYEDITDRKRTEEALREADELLQTAVTQSPSGILIASAPDVTIRMANPAALGIRGGNKGLLTGIDVTQHSVNWLTFLPDGSPCPPEQLPLSRAILKGEVVRNEEVIIRDEDGNDHWVSANAAPVYNLQGNITAGIVIFHDITERKQLDEKKKILEERLQRSEKMEALGTLAGGVAHDLNNVLGVLSGYSEILAEQIPEGSHLKQYAVNILKSSQKGAVIIQDLLTLARRGVVVADVVDLNGIIRDYLTTPQFDKINTVHPLVSVKTDLGQDLLHIKGSAVHLEKVVMNLVANAAESIVGSGEITIRTENRYLDHPISSYDKVEVGDYVVLTVSDTGRGISATDLNKIFEPFYTKKVMGRSGTGLGLAIVWGTVKDHNGYIDVQSIEEQGTTFTLYFPVTREDIADAVQKRPQEQYQGKGESVLVVDDVEEQRQVATTILTQLGYRVNAVSGGKDALEYLRSNAVDILVLDMIMDPGIDGLDTYKLVLNINPHQKAIIVSGFSETDRVREALKLGVGAYVKKPYLMEKIGVAIRDELARK